MCGNSVCPPLARAIVAANYRGRAGPARGPPAADHLRRRQGSRGAPRHFDGVGFCPMPEWGVTALDFDGCVTAGGVHPDVERIVAGTYAEFSPFGNGVRAFVRGELVGNRKSNRGQAIGFETFHSKGFVTFTGNVLPITELTDATNTVAEPGPELLALCEARFGATEAPSEPASVSAEPLGLTIEQLREALDVLPRDLGLRRLAAPWAWPCTTRPAAARRLRALGRVERDQWQVRRYGLRPHQVGQLRPRRPARHHRASPGAHGQRTRRAHRDRAAGGGGRLRRRADRRGRAGAGEAATVPAGAGRRLRRGKPPGWLVKNVIPAADLIVLFGESGSGKTFMVLDIVAAVARGVEWRGNKVKRGRVVVIAAEGGAGFRNRLKAYAAKHGLDLERAGRLGDPRPAQHAAEGRRAGRVPGDPGHRRRLAGGDRHLRPGDARGERERGRGHGQGPGPLPRHPHRHVKAPVLLVHHSGKDQAAARGAGRA
jgi:hypothetical protein